MDTEKLARTFVDLSDTMVEDFDILDMLQLLVDRTVELLGVEAAGLVLADEAGRLRVAATSSEQARLIELFQIQCNEGPCVEAYDTGRPVYVSALAQATGQWPAFAERALADGFVGMAALPLRLRGLSLGALNLFRTAASEDMGDRTLTIAQAMADVSAIAILQHRMVLSRDVLTKQLQSALDSRVSIEQAKGVLATALDVDFEEAFEVLRGHARRTRRPLAEVARDVVDNRRRIDGFRLPTSQDG